MVYPYQVCKIFLLFEKHYQNAAFSSPISVISVCLTVDIKMRFKITQLSPAYKVYCGWALKETLLMWFFLSLKMVGIRLWCHLLKNLVHNLFKFVSGAIILYTVYKLYNVLKLPLAKVLHAWPYSQQALRGANVQGTQNVLLFACSSKIKPLHYIRYAKIMCFFHANEYFQGNRRVINIEGETYTVYKLLYNWPNKTMHKQHNVLSSKKKSKKHQRDNNNP